MNTMQLLCFLTVAETLNFARAAEQLHVTQPAVTQQIHSLEAELNVQLFRRTTRTVELTQEGFLFLEDARTIVEIFQRAKKRSETASADTRETFLIGCHSSNDIPRLSRILEAMREPFPHLYPVFRVIPFQHLYQRLSEEDVDVVVAFREGVLKKAIHYQELTKIPLVGIARDHDVLAQKETLCLSNLKQSPIILLDPQKCPEEYRKSLHPVLEGRSPAEVFFCDVIEAAVSLSQAGYGVAMLPDFFGNKDPSLRYIPIADAPPISYGVYYKTLAGHPLRRAFVKLAKENFPAMTLS